MHVCDPRVEYSSEYPADADEEERDQREEELLFESIPEVCDYMKRATASLEQYMQSGIARIRSLHLGCQNHAVQTALDPLIQLAAPTMQSLGVNSSDMTGYDYFSYPRFDVPNLRSAELRAPLHTQQIPIFNALLAHCVTQPHFNLVHVNKGFLSQTLRAFQTLALARRIPTLRITVGIDFRNIPEDREKYALLLTASDSLQIVTSMDNMNNVLSLIENFTYTIRRNRSLATRKIRFFAPSLAPAVTPSIPTPFGDELQLGGIPQTLHLYASNPPPAPIQKTHK